MFCPWFALAEFPPEPTSPVVLAAPSGDSEKTIPCPEGRGGSEMRQIVVLRGRPRPRITKSPAAHQASELLSPPRDRTSKRF